MNTLKTIFYKPVDRHIEGVIKADDEASLRQEIEEYVLTNEVERRFESFLSAYNSYEGANGVWVSGFFGSGKSHLLKMLALLLENRQVDGASTVDLFVPKCGDNEILRGDLKRAITIPSKSILFNIDQKADVISKTQIDALLAVFVKVFDEMCGYYGKQGYIAQFERDLDSRRLYEQFKSAYESISGLIWEKGREQALFEDSNIAKAYAQVNGGDEAQALGILDKYRKEYRVSIEDFAEQVHDYIDNQSPDFRLNFFVDEVGQYIAENVKLMTNLQTIAESLATKCRGRAWIVVTAQEDMDTVVGEMGQQQGNDFSKIQDRFRNRMKLTSADVAEVIQKRLLSKNEDGVSLLSEIYQSEVNNFRTLFDFADGSQAYRNFQDRDHFIHSYPFIPYQFGLFQAAIQNLSQHNAFEGKHSSVGERSMLGVFQQVALRIGDQEVGELATFDLMFEGIRTALKSNIQRAIIQAENHLESQFAIRLLKALFLVKYVKEFKASLRNLCVLMLESFNQDIPELRKRVEEALSLLEQQTYIQRNGELYEYLTDEEKDIEQEIKNTEVEQVDIAAELSNLIFDHVIKTKKIRYDENGQDYPFSKKLDDHLYGREQELAIHVASPFNENAESEAILLSQSLGRDELLVLMPTDARLVSDLMMYKRTEKYIRQNTTITQQEAVKRILADKGFQNTERYNDLKQRVKALLSKAKLFVKGSEIEITSEDAQSRIIRSFYELIAKVYSSLTMLRGVTYKEEDVGKYLEHSQEGLFGGDATVLSEAEQEILAHIQSNQRGGIRTTLKKLMERFEHKPYGWYYAAVLCNLAKLCARGKVEVRDDSNILEGKELERALLNGRGHGNIILEPQVEFTASQIRALKDFYADFFDSPPQANEAKALGKETGAAIKNLIHALKLLAAQASQYPFLNALTPIIDQLQELTERPYTWYLTELVRQEDTLLDMKEGILDPVRKFMSGSQKDIFDKAMEFVRAQETNFTYVEGEDAEQIKSALFDPECFKGNRMQQIKAWYDELQTKVAAQIELEIRQAKEKISGLQERFCAMPEFGSLNGDQQGQIIKPFQDVEAAIERQDLIAVIRETLRRFEETEYQNQLARMTNWAKPPASDPGQGGGDGDAGGKPPKVEFIPSRNVTVQFEKPWLEDETDVDRYLKSMREALLAEINKGKRIQI